ncbi:MAG: hypothetical protein AAFQ21_03940 [Pseudomonadota bacterium]
MMTFLGMFSRASAKLVATFITVILLMMLSFAVMPWAITGLQNFIETLDALTRDPPLNDQAKVLYRTLVNENTMFGIVMTIIARAIVETVAWIGGRLFTGSTEPKPRTPTAPGPGGATDYYGRT